MKNVRPVMVHGLLIAGMIYALLSVAVLPAAACTPSQCNTLSQIANSMCQLHDCPDGGELVLCDSSGWEIDCYGGCGVFGGQC
jgi:hypothetical protein